MNGGIDAYWQVFALTLHHTGKDIGIANLKGTLASLQSWLQDPILLELTGFPNN